MAVAIALIKSRKTLSASVAACSRSTTPCPAGPIPMTIEPAMHRCPAHPNAAPMMARSALERLETVMTEAGELEKSQWVDFDALVDNSFAEKAMDAVK